jgi:hypothetical protein
MITLCDFKVQALCGGQGWWTGGRYGCFSGDVHVEFIGKPADVLINEFFCQIMK